MASNYNSRYKPAEVLWMNGEGHLIRAHETFEDLLKIKFIYTKEKRFKIKNPFTLTISCKWDFSIQKTITYQVKFLKLLTQCHS
jgi:hypothetical protein